MKGRVNDSFPTVMSTKLTVMSTGCALKTFFDSLSREKPVLSALPNVNSALLIITKTAKEGRSEARCGGEARRGGARCGAEDRSNDVREGVECLYACLVPCTSMVAQRT